ncbi:MAG TPA: pilus assembly protein PilV [Albitalea sp.]|uniref:type IV pilus modification PilV family protein n=1 Tax=Piscinibacter sp. TaxID=1903157 RepID=UPI002ED38AC6
MNKRFQSRRRARARMGGFALIEALVGLLIFSIGILGLVGVQVSMTKAQTLSKFRADAAALAGELVGAMWADLPNVGLYADASCASHPRCKRWSDKVAATLPGGTPVVAVAGGTVTITITWTAPNEAPARYVTATAIRS